MRKERDNDFHGNFLHFHWVMKPEDACYRRQIHVIDIFILILQSIIDIFFPT